jgi:hypothetical protein
MFAGNKEVALKELEELIYRAVKRALSTVFSWRLPSEQKLLEIIQQRSSLISNNLMADFIDLPINSWMYITQTGPFVLPCEKIVTEIVAEISLLWKYKTKYQVKKLKLIKHELLVEFLLLAQAWRQANYESICQEEVESLTVPTRRRRSKSSTTKLSANGDRKRKKD